MNMKRLVILSILFLIGYQSYCQNDSIKRATMQSKANEMTAIKDFKTAAQIYSEMIVSFPNDLRLVHDRAIMFMMATDYERAIPDFTKLIDSNYKDVGEAYYFRGLCKVVSSNNACEDLIKAKVLGYDADWTNLKLMCPDLNKN